MVKIKRLYGLLHTHEYGSSLYEFRTSVCGNQLRDLFADDEFLQLIAQKLGADFEPIKNETLEFVEIGQEFEDLDLFIEEYVESQKVMETDDSND